jgi:predicted nucleic acid-binding protein
VTPIVCDASVTVAWVIDEEQSLAARLLPHGPAPLLAPTILLAETANALLSRIRRRQPTPAGYPEVALHEIRAGAIAFTSDAVLLDSAMAIALRLGHPIYDCFYLALCRREEAMLATFDARLARHAETLAIPLWTPEAPDP